MRQFRCILLFLRSQNLARFEFGVSAHGALLGESPSRRVAARIAEFRSPRVISRKYLRNQPVPVGSDSNGCLLECL